MGGGGGKVGKGGHEIGASGGIGVGGPVRDMEQQGNVV